MNGIPVISSPYAPPPRPPTPSEQARRIVRHGLADVLAWLGEDVGPEPDAPVHTAYVFDTGALFYGSGVVLNPRSVVAITGLTS